MIEIRCPVCGNTFSVRDEYSGKVCKCKYCKETVKVPEIEKPKPVDPPPPQPQITVNEVAEWLGQNAKAQPVVEHKHDAYGAWCPHCGNRCSVKTSSGGGCLFACFIFVSMGLALLLIPFLPKEWHCQQCQHKWRA